MKQERGRIRQTQLVSTYGVGAIVAFGNETFMVAGLDEWFGGAKLYDQRLAQELGVKYFQTPPTGEQGDVGSVKFPMWAFCTGCRRLAPRYVLAAGPDDFHCKDCEEDLSPSRFVVACDDGHIDDFPYSQWVHEFRGATPGEHALKLESVGNSLSLSGLVVSCACGRRRSMQDVFNRAEMRLNCRGTTPWLQTDQRQASDKRMVTMQRGASSVWMAKTSAAITIPPWSSEAMHYLTQNPGVASLPDDSVRQVLRGQFARITDQEIDDSIAALRPPREGESLLEQEYKALRAGKPQTSSRQEFVAVPQDVSALAQRLGISRLVKAERLREVRALYGFDRGKGNADATFTEARQMLSRQTLDWLPAVEVIGEGLFVDFAGPRLDRFLQGSFSVQRHAEQAARDDDGETPRFVLLHTLAHALMDEVAAFGGYPLPSLQERIYAAEAQGGILIYTSTSDAAGSLGGLSALAEPSKFDAILQGAAQRLAWCTNDPVCIEGHHTGVDGTNMAACHACMLVPEVSCHSRNGWLDRALLVGKLGGPEDGFLTSER